MTDTTRPRAARLRNRLASAERPVQFADAVRAVLAEAVETAQPPLST